MGLAIGQRALGPDQLYREARLRQIGGKVVADLAIVMAGRVQRRNADQILRQPDQRDTPGVDLIHQAGGVYHVHKRSLEPRCGAGQ